MRKIIAVIAAVLCLTVSETNSAFCAQPHSWEWNVLVIPPSGGWETDPGKSISTALSWCEREISESSSGVGGHDVKFLRAEVSGDVGSFQALGLHYGRDTIAVMSFAELPELDRVLVSRMAGRDVPLILAGGESVLIDRGGRPAANIFALDLFRDYRASAFTEYARRIYSREKRIALAASKFTVNQEREAKICYDLLDKAGFMPMPYWADASVRDSYSMMSEEIESFEGEEAGVVISFMGSMASREIWRNFMRLRSNWRLWNCAAPDNTYLSCRWMVFADQNIMLSSQGGFLETKRMLWRTRALQVNDPVAAGKAIALYEWLKRAVELMPQPVDAMPRNQLLVNLGRVQGIPFGNQVLNIAPNLHRPSERDAYIVDVRDRKYSYLDTVRVKGLAYVPVE
ncbi:MAG: hypothetical protein IJS28_05495 [Synergistaceae bacterium]|nr:hypothetical protein [Synergistaceae bacterium]